MSKKIIQYTTLFLISWILLFFPSTTYSQNTEFTSPNTSVAVAQGDAPLYLYYFETDDVMLHTDETQDYQFDAFAGEDITIAVYGLDELVIPQLTLYNSAGEVVRNGQSDDIPHFNSIRYRVPRDERFTFNVTAAWAEDGGGLARVMLVEGDALDGDLTYLDTVNPLLPGRVFMVSGSDEKDEEVSIDDIGLRVGAEVLPVDRFRHKPDIFVSRGSAEFLPPHEERITPTTSRAWFNVGDEKVYFFTVSPIPEQVTTATSNVQYEALNLLTFFYFDYFFIVGAGSDPIIFGQHRQDCSDVTLENREGCDRAPIERPVVFTEDGDENEVSLPPDDTTTYTTFFCDYYEGYSWVIDTYSYYEHIVCYEDTFIMGEDSTDVSDTDGDGRIYGGGGNDNIDGTDNDDIIAGDNVHESVCTSYNEFGYTYYYYCYSYFDYFGTDDYWGTVTDAVNGAGNDVIEAGAGNDQIYASDGIDRVWGGVGDDIIVGDNAYIEVYCYQYYYSASVDYVEPICYNDLEWIFIITYGTGNDFLYGEEGNDTIYGGNGDDTIDGGGEFDTVEGCDTIEQDDIVDCDTIFGGGGNDTIDGGNGDDYIEADDWCGSGGIDTVYGGSGNDTIIGGFGDDFLDGEDGDDWIYGGDGYWFCLNESDNDTIVGGTGDDFIYGEGGDDIFVFTDATYNDNDYIDGGDWDEVTGDTLDYDLVTENVNVTLLNNPNITNIENITGGSGDDSLTGDANSNTLIGGVGEDILDGGAGVDTLEGGADDDTFIYTDATYNDGDIVDGGEGGEDEGDTLNYSVTTIGVTVDLSSNTNITNIENITGGTGNDILTGDAEDNTLMGGAGSDTLTGEDGDDTIEGGDGNDTIDGGAGEDILEGEAGDDTFVYTDATASTPDTIDGGETGEIFGDTLDYSQITTDVTVDVSNVTNIENIIGGSGNDGLEGDGGANSISGGAGVDTIDGGDGNDRIDGGTGDDDLDGGADDDTFIYTDATVNDNDTVDGGSGTDVMDYSVTTVGVTVDLLNDTNITDIENVTGGSGNDFLTGDDEVNVLIGNGGNDTFIFTDATANDNDTITGGAGLDTLDYTATTTGVTVDLLNNINISGIENITGGSGSDFITGNSLDNVLLGNGGDDTFIFTNITANDNDTIDGGVGIDTLDYTTTTINVTVDLNNGNFSNIEIITGGSGDDDFQGDSGNNTIFGGDGNDVIEGNAGDDTIDGGFGDDTIDGGIGDDMLTGGDGNDVIEGNAGNDTIDGGIGDDMLTGGDGSDTFIYTDITITDNDVVDGGVGIDTLDYSLITTDVIVDVSNVTNIENIIGGFGNDILEGGIEDNAIFGGAGDDTIFGGFGIDTLDGGAGNDIINGEFGNDTIFGGAGNDSLNGGSGIDTLDGGAGNDTINGDDGNDIITGGDGADSLNGGAGNDTFIETDTTGANSIDGGDDYDAVDYSGETGNLDVTVTGGGGNNLVATVGTDSVQNVESYTSGSGNDAFTINDNFVLSDESEPIVLNGGIGTDSVTFAFDAGGYFTLIGVESIIVCDNNGCGGPTDITNDLIANIGVWYDVPGTNITVCYNCPAPLIAPPAPMMALNGTSGSDLWELTAPSDTPADGGEGDDTYRLAAILGIEINDTGSSGTDTVVFAVENSALTIEVLSETSYTASSGTNTIFLNGIENIETGTANDIFLLDYDANSVSNVFDASENADATDRDTVIIQSTLDLTLAFSGSMVTVSETGHLSEPADTLMNFEVLRSGTGNDTFVMGDGLVQGFDLDGDAGLNSILYDNTSDLTVNLIDNNVMNVTDGLLTDTLSNFSSVTTGDGDDTFNLDINAASTTTAYNFNAGGGNNIFRFFFDGDNPLTDTVAMTVGADGENNVLDFTGVDVAVNIDLDLRTPQEIFDNFVLTLEGVFEAVFNPEVEELAEVLPPVVVESSETDAESADATTPSESVDVPVESTEEAIDGSEQTTLEVTEGSPAPTDEPSTEPTPAPETTPES